MPENKKSSRDDTVYSGTFVKRLFEEIFAARIAQEAADKVLHKTACGGFVVNIINSGKYPDIKTRLARKEWFVWISD